MAEERIPRPDGVEPMGGTQDPARERRRLFAVLETLPVYVILLTPDYRVAFANRFFRERFGEDRGHRCFEYLFGRSEACENCETYKTLATGAPQRWEWKGPDDRFYDIHDFPFTDADGVPMILEVGIDITERKLAEDELARHKEHLEELVDKRTVELEEVNSALEVKIADLARFNRLAVGRELRMVELKRQVNELCQQLGKPPRYSLE